MTLTGSATFPTYLIKREKYRFNQKIDFPCDTKWCIQEITIYSGWNTHIVRILYKKCDGAFLFKGNFLSILPKPVGLSHECIRRISSIMIQSFTLDCLMSQKTDPLKFLLGVQRHMIKKYVPDATKLYVL